MLQARYPAALPVERGFLSLPHGDLHYRAAGDGPVVLALHESPRSSLSLLPVIDILAGRYRVIAPDTPGYGLSDPLASDAPGLDDFLDVIGALLDRLGVRRAALYGTHTGAALAAAFARREPARVSALVLDGLSVFTEAEATAFASRYLTPYEPHWDGRHVMGLWSRAKDLFTWFPWYDRTPARRLATDPADVGPLHRSALGFLQSGPHYAKAYIHGANFQANAVMRDLAPPATVIARPDDLIADHLGRLAPGPGWEIVWLDPTIDAWRDAIFRGLGKGCLPDEASPAVPATQGSRFLPVGDGWLHVQTAGPQDGPVRLLIPGLPGDPVALLASQAKAHPAARLVALTSPGCGWSDPLAGGGGDLAATVEALDLAVLMLGLEPSSLAGEGAAGVLADLLARRRGWSIPVDHLDPPAWMTGQAALPRRPLLTSAAPGWDGSHLTAAWFQLRDLQLYDVPPGAGAVARSARRDATDVVRLDRLFRNYVQGPECADLLAAVVDHLRTGSGPA